MLNEFKFQCVHCSKKFTVPIGLTGRLIKCPFCKKIVRLPKVEPVTKMDLALASTRRTILPKRRRFPFGMIIKWLCILSLVFLAYHGYEYYQKQSHKDVQSLFAEYNANPTIENAYLIKKKLSLKDQTILLFYAKSSEKHTRMLVAECLPQVRYDSRIYNIIEKYLETDDDDIKIATADSCGEIKKKIIIEFLIARLHKEKESVVKGAIGRALRKITGVTGNSANEQRWEIWWKENKKNYD